MQYGPERSVIFAAYWLVLSIVFAIAMPLVRRRGRSLVAASVFGALIAVLVTVVTFAVLLFALTPRVGAAAVIDAGQFGAEQSVRDDSTVRTPPAVAAARIPAALFAPAFLDSDVPAE
jgi:hypothetical protein